MSQRSLHICVPAYGCRVFLNTLACLMHLRHEAAVRGIVTTVRMVGNDPLITRGRNLLVADFVASGFTHMLFVDADIVFSPDDIFEMMDFDKDVVCGIYARKSVAWARTRSPQHASEAVCQRGLDFNINLDARNLCFEGKFCRVLDAATGLMLIKRSTIDKLYVDHAYLTCANDMPDAPGLPAARSYCAIFDCMIDPESRRYLSEDYAFCRRVQWSGLEVWAMLTCVTGHIGSMHVDTTDPLVIESLTQRFERLRAASAPLPAGKIVSIDDLRRAYLASMR